MALRLAGEEFSVVQGLDSQGWLEKTIKQLLIEKAIAEMFLKDTQAGAPGIKIRANGNEFFFLRGDNETVLAEIVISTLTWYYTAIAPFANDTYDLGATSSAWRCLYVRRLKNPGTGDGGAIFVDDALAVLSNLKLGGVTGNYSALLRPMTNRNASRTMLAGDVVKLDTANDQSVVDTTGASELNPFIVVDGGAPGTDCTVAVAGICLVNCDTAAINRGDLLVTSATSLQATMDNTMTDARKILGIALTTKGAGATGTVVALIKL